MTILYAMSQAMLIMLAAIFLAAFIVLFLKILSWHPVLGISVGLIYIFAIATIAIYESGGVA